MAKKKRRKRRKHVTVEQITDELERLDKKIRWWESKLKSAMTALSGYRKKERYYRTKLSELATLQAKTQKVEGADRFITVEDDE